MFEDCCSGKTCLGLCFLIIVVVNHRGKVGEGKETRLPNRENTMNNMWRRSWEWAEWGSLLELEGFVRL